MKKNEMIIKQNKRGYEMFSREYFVEMGRKGGKAGKGKSKIRKSAFNSKTGKLAITSYWKNK